MISINEERSIYYLTVLSRNEVLWFKSGELTLSEHRFSSNQQYRLTNNFSFTSECKSCFSIQVSN
jgi:hypothetical protein